MKSIKHSQKRRRQAPLIFSIVFGGFIAPLHAESLSFEQLNWIGSASSTADSTWGRVTLDFTGFSATEYFNLNINGNWVVRNMGIDSLYGAGVNQTVTTFFDLGVANGTDVSTLVYDYSFSMAPQTSAPTSFLANGSVQGLDYQIGGIDDLDTGSPAAPATPTGGNAATVTSSAKLPGIDKFINQPQGLNECAPGALSNSLKYLQATGQLSPDIPTDISVMRTIVKTGPKGSPRSWATLKARSFNGIIDTKEIGATDIDDLIKAVNAGKDVELSLSRHAAVVAGVRKYSDGRVELDIFDDNQTDNKSDPMRTVTIIDGKVDGMDIVSYVIESPVPESSSMSMLVAGLLTAIFFMAQGRKTRPEHRFSLHPAY